MFATEMLKWKGRKEKLGTLTDWRPLGNCCPQQLDRNVVWICVLLATIPTTRLLYTYIKLDLSPVTTWGVTSTVPAQTSSQKTWAQFCCQRRLLPGAILKLSLERHYKCMLNPKRKQWDMHYSLRYAKTCTQMEGAKENMSFTHTMLHRREHVRDLMQALPLLVEWTAPRSGVH